MSKKATEKKPPVRFTEGHPRFGGRKPGAISVKRRTANEIIANLEEELGRPCHPLEGLLRIANDERQPMDLRASCFRDALPYVLPRLQQSAVLQADVALDASVQLPTAAILADPALCAALSDAALLVATGGTEPSTRPSLPTAGMMTVDTRIVDD